jgi:maleate cis-trans isomerase
MRAIGAIEALEQTFGLPVLSANQVALWNALRLADLHAGVSHYGRIFATGLPLSMTATAVQTLNPA